MGKKASQWLMRNLKQMVVEVKPKHFFTFKEGIRLGVFTKLHKP